MKAHSSHYAKRQAIRPAAGRDFHGRRAEPVGTRSLTEPDEKRLRDTFTVHAVNPRQPRTTRTGNTPPEIIP